LSRDETLAALRERIFSFAASRLGRDSAEDLAQETLMVLERKYSTVAEPGELVALSFQILRFQMRAWVRKRRRRGEDTAAQVDLLPLASSNPGPEEQLERAELRERLYQALAQLGERCRTLFRLRLEGRSLAEILEAMGRPPENTLYVWELRCRKELMERMGVRKGDRR
jgi:RNA polymerase sigma-70 factor (ECF subfamily)